MTAKLILVKIRHDERVFPNGAIAKWKTLEFSPIKKERAISRALRKSFAALKNAYKLCKKPEPTSFHRNLVGAGGFWRVR